MWLQTVIEQLPPDVVDRLPADVVEQLRDGTLDKIPEDVVNRLPEGVADRIPTTLIDFASTNPVLTAILAIIGVLAVIGFFYGIFKHTIKIAVYSAIAAAVAWFFFFNSN